MWDSVLWWLTTIPFTAAVFWIVLTLLEIGIGGGLVGILLTIASLFIPSVRTLAQKSSQANYIQASRVINLLALAAAWAIVILIHSRGQLNGPGIIDLVTSPIMLVFWGLVSSFIASQAQGNYSSMRMMGTGVVGNSILLTLPSFLFLLFVDIDGRGTFAYWAAASAFVFASIGVIYGVAIVLPRRVKEVRLDIVDDAALEQIEPLARWSNIIQYIPRFVSIRREIDYLVGIRESAWRQMTTGDLAGARAQYDLFDFEIARISDRLRSELSANFREELLAQLRDQSMRADSLAAAAASQALRDAIESVKFDINQAADALSQRNDWNIDNDLREQSEKVVQFLSRVDRLEALGATDAESEAPGRDNAQDLEVIEIATRLGFDTEAGANRLKALNTTLAAIGARDVGSVHELRELVAKADALAIEFDKDIDRLKRDIAGSFQSHAHSEYLSVIAPRAAPAGEQAKLLLVVRGLDANCPIETLTVDAFGPGIEFGISHFSFTRGSPELRFAEVIFKPRSSKRTTLQLRVQTTGATSTQTQLNHDFHVSPNIFELIQQAGVVSTAVGVLLAVIFFLLGRDTSEASVIGAGSAIAFFVLRAGWSLFQRYRSGNTKPLSVQPIPA